MRNRLELVVYPDATKDVTGLGGSQHKMVAKAIERVLANPLPQDRGGHGKPLGNRADGELAGYMKVKLRGSGLRVVYRLVELSGRMAVIVVGARKDGEAYRVAARRRADFEAWLDGLA